jgi:hypothetical protein
MPLAEPHQCDQPCRAATGSQKGSRKRFNTLRMARIGFVGQVPMTDVAVKRPVPAQNASTALVKDAVADRLRTEIASEPCVRVFVSWRDTGRGSLASHRPQSARRSTFSHKKALLPKLRAAARASSTLQNKMSCISFRCGPDADLQFHLELCRLSNNPYVFDHAKRVLCPSLPSRASG